MPFILLAIFVFLVGACVGSFLNVVVWRLPRTEFQENDNLFQQVYRAIKGLSTPASHCPRCNTPLAWYDNFPILGWIFLRGKCRHCHESISARYPIIELLTAVLFVSYFLLYFRPMGHVHLGPIIFSPDDVYAVPLRLRDHWPILALHLVLLAGLLAASLIDLELFIIPLEIPYAVAAIAIIFHTAVDADHQPGAVLCQTPITLAMAGGGVLGLLVSGVASWQKWLPLSFPQGEPIFEADRAEIEKELDAARLAGETVQPLPPPYTRRQIRAEMRREMAFLIPPMAAAIAMVMLALRVPPVNRVCIELFSHIWLRGLAGSLLGAMVGGLVVWLVRILGTLVFGKVAMGLGDVHLMFGVGAVVGAEAATIAFFLAPFFGIITAIWMLIFHRRRELPYGPYLSLATAFVMIVYFPIARYLQPGLESLDFLARQFSGTG